MVLPSDTPSPEMLHLLLAGLPPSLRDPHATEVLHGGQSGAALILLHFVWGDAVLKGPLKAREARFYQEVAPHFVERGIEVPKVYALIDHDQTMWLLREAFPDLLPMRRWFGDAEVLRTLHQVHTLSAGFPLSDPFQPTWPKLHASYLPVLPDDLAERIAHVVARHSQLFLPTTVIVGDPNTTNWGLRADGTVVLFDWEYVGYGTPARDLGNLIPQLGWPTLYEQIATRYLSLVTPDPPADQIRQFTHDMTLGRLQSILEYVNAPEIATDNRDYVLGLLPSWLMMVEHMDEAFHQ